MSAVVLALLAGLLFAVAARVQQSAARALLAARRSARRRHIAVLPIIGALSRLVCDRLWIIGWGVNAMGFVIQAIALHRGSLALVQPILVCQLLFTIPVAVFGTGRRPGPMDWIAGLSVCLGIVVFVDVWGTGAERGADRSRVVAAVAVSWALVAALVAMGSRMRQARRAALASVAAGLCFSTSAVLMKLTIDPLIRQGPGTALTDWPFYVLFVSTTLGLVIGQDALAAGSLPTVAAGMTITNPLASAAIGVLAFHERVPLHTSNLISLSFAGVLLTAGVIGLAMSPVLRILPPAAGHPRPATSTHSRGLLPDWAHRTDAGAAPGPTMASMVPTEQART